MRLSPLVPFNVFNYVMGITSVPLWKYALAGVGMVPVIVLDVYLGCIMNDVAEAVSGDSGNSWLTLALYGVGAIIAIVAIVVMTCLIK